MGDLPLWANALLFALSAAAIWWAGTRLEHTAAILAERTGMGEAFSGMLLLAVATSLPEVATTVTAVAILHNPTLAVHNLLGGVALQTLLIAVADASQRKRGALTSRDPQISLLIQGVGLLLLLHLTIAGIAAKGMPVVFSISAWLIVVVLAYLAMLLLMHRSRRSPRWRPTAKEGAPGAPSPPDQKGGPGRRGPSTPAAWLMFAGLGLLVLVGGWLAAHTADQLAEQTGLGAAFLGATLLAGATSFPELSTTLSAARHDRVTAAISNVFGSNAFCVVLLLLADLLYRDGSILARAEPTVVFVSALGAAMTSLYLWGMIEREDRTVLRLGWDSVAVIALYGVGVAVLYLMQ